MAIKSWKIFQPAGLNQKVRKLKQEFSLRFSFSHLIIIITLLHSHLRLLFMLTVRKFPFPSSKCVFSSALEHIYARFDLGSCDIETYNPSFYKHTCFLQHLITHGGFFFYPPLNSKFFNFTPVKWNEEREQRSVLLHYLKA